MKLSIAAFYPAHSSNYAKGRYAPVDRITVHHTAGFETTLRHLWQNPARNASSHFFVHPDYIEQYVDTNDTAYTNGNLDSNNRAITIETRGDWRNGYYDQKTLDQLQRLLVELRKHYPNARLTYHQDESSAFTECPADLKHRGYAKAVWDNATAILAPKPQPTPAPAISYKKITPKRVQLHRVANLWNFNFSKWADAKAVGNPYPAGHVIDVVAEATNSLGGKYYMTAYSYNEGNIRATNGFNVADCKDFVEPAPVPVPTPVPPKPEPKPEPLPPVNTDPTTPSDSDVVKRLNALEALVQKIVDFLSSVFSGFKK